MDKPIQKKPRESRGWTTSTLTKPWSHQNWCFGHKTKPNLEYHPKSIITLEEFFFSLSLRLYRNPISAHYALNRDKSLKIYRVSAKTGQGIPRPLGLNLGTTSAQDSEIHRQFQSSKPRLTSQHTMASRKRQGWVENHCYNPEKPCHRQQENHTPTCKSKHVKTN